MIGRRRVDPGFVLRWLAIPALVGAIAAAALDPAALPFAGTERISAVFLLDGQAYFGHLDDVPWSGTVTLTDVYYFNDATRTTTDLPVALSSAEASSISRPMGSTSGAKRSWRSSVSIS